MSKATKSAPDAENPEWTEARIKNSMRLDELPESLQQKLRGRGPQKAPTKERVGIRLSPEVLESFRATGTGWQSRIDNALKDWLKSHRPQ